MIDTTYRFDELDYDVQNEVVERYQDINVDNDYWYEQIVSDFEDIGATIERFDLYNGVEISFYLGIHEVAEYAIEKNITLSLTRSALDFLESENNEDNQIEFYLDIKEEAINLLRDRHRHLTSYREVAYAVANSELLFNRKGDEI